MQRLEKLMELLKKNQKYNVTYKKNIANHLSIDLIALYFLNASSEELQNIYDKYIPELEHILPSDFAITGINWKNNLGSGQYYWSYYKFFRAKKSILGLEQVLRDYLPHLIKGMVGGLFYPLIRLSYALDLWSYAGVQNNQQLNSIAEEESIIALAYFADSYTELPIYNECSKTLSVLFKQLIAEPTKTNSDILSQIKHIANTSNTYKALSSTIVSRQDNFSTLAHEISQLYISYQDVMLLKSLTSLHALRLVADFLPQGYALNYYWHAFMAVYLSINKILTKNTPQIRNNAPDEIQEKLYLLTDSHQIQLLYTAVQELECYNDENYLKIINLILPD